MTTRRFTILGCGSSGGVPRLGGFWGACQPDNPRNRRRRCSLLVEQEEQGSVTTALVDVSPDMRAQLLDAGIGEVDGVLITHAHADHVNGIDDLRVLAMNRGEPVKLWADEETGAILLHRFGYALSTRGSSTHPPFVEVRSMTDPVVVTGAGGSIEFMPLSVQHGSIKSLGFRIDQLAYIPDVSEIPESVWPSLANLECWIIDALQTGPHISHSHLDQTLDWIKRAAPRSAYLTNMGTRMDYDTIAGMTPPAVQPAHDGLVMEYRL